MYVGAVELSPRGGSEAAAMTAPPREPDAWMYTKEGQEPCFNGHGRRFETYGKEWTEVPLYAAPAPSADQDQNGGQGHEAYVHCSLGALPLESGNAREATCLNTEPSARTGTDTQQGQLGANAGSISAPPTSTPAAQPAEPVLPCAIDGCKQPSLMPASEYCSLHSAIGTSPTGGEFATQPAEPPATDDLVRRLTARAAYVRGEYRQDLRDAADLIERQAREIAMLRLAVKDDAQWAQENERLTRERDEWKCKCGDANVWGLRNAAAWKERAERSEAERDALRECVRAADAMRERMGKLGWSGTADAYDAARAKVKP